MPLFSPARSPRDPAAVPGVPAVIGAYTSTDATARTTVGTHRIPHIVGVAGTNIRLVYTNWLVNGSFADLDNAASITVKASVETSGGTIIPVTFSGRLSVTIDGGGFVVSDPVGMEVAPGQALYVRTFLTPTTNWYRNRVSNVISNQGGFVSTTDLTPAGSGAIADTAGTSMFGPSLITVEPTTSSRIAVQLFGDSVGHGQSDGIGGQYSVSHATNPMIAGCGFVGRALRGVGGLIQSAVPGDSATNFRSAATGHSRRLAFMSTAPVVICQYGRNDVTNLRSVAQIQDDLLWIWRLASGRGQRVWQTTVTPRASSTDFWQTPEGQTPTPSSAAETVRVQLNDWLRAGAPVDAVSGAAVAIGTPGAVVSGTPAHPLTGVLDVADAVETSRNSGLWKPWVNSRTVSDAVTTASSFTITSATGAFTSADLGRTITIPGAGAAGATFQGVIATVNSATSIVVSASPSTSLSGASATIASTWTRDGTHTDSYAATQMAAVINPGAL